MGHQLFEGDGAERVCEERGVATLFMGETGTPRSVGLSAVRIARNGTDIMSGNV